jgi:WD40 repeat protein/uncharacterized caspase-like protein
MWVRSSRNAVAAMLFVAALAFTPIRLIAAPLEDLRNTHWLYGHLANGQEQGLTTARALRKQGKYDEAIPVYEKALESYDPNLAQASGIAPFDELALIYVSRGRWKEAEATYNRLIVFIQKFYGDPAHQGLYHPYMGNALDELGSIYEHQRRYREAEETYKRELGHLRNWRINHDDDPKTLDKLANVYNRLGRNRDADAIHARASKTREPFSGAIKPDERHEAKSNQVLEVVPNVGHSEDVSAVVLSPNERIVLSASEDATLKLWELETGRLIRSISTGSAIHAILFAPDGRQAMSGGTDGSLSIWDVQTSKPIRVIHAHDDWVTALAVSRDGKTIGSGSRDGTVKLWDARTGRLLSVFSHPMHRPIAIAFSQDGQKIAALDEGLGLFIWSLKSGDFSRRHPAAQIGEGMNYSALSTDGRYFILQRAQKRGEAGYFEVWNSESEKSILSQSYNVDGFSSWNGPNYVFSSDTKNLLVRLPNSHVDIWNLAESRITHSETSDATTAEAPTFMPNGHYLAVRNGRDLAVWNGNTGQLVHRYASQTSNFAPTAISANGRRVVTIQTKDTEVKLVLWDLETGQPLQDLIGQPSRPISIAISPDCRFVAAGGEDRRFRIWDAETGRLILTSEEQEGSVLSVALSHDGKMLLSGNPANKGEGKLKVWDTQTTQLIRSFSIKGNEDIVRRSVFSPDDEYVIARDMVLRHISSGEVYQTYHLENSPTYTIAFSTDGDRIASGNHAQEFNVFDIASARTLKRLSHPALVNHAVVQHLAFSPDNILLLSALRRTAPSSGDINRADTNTLKLWDADTGQLVRNLEGNTSQTTALAFSGDGRRVVAASIDGTVRVWSVASGAILTTTYFLPGGEWVTVTPEGYFDASDNGARLLNVVRGSQLYSIDQFYQALYRPDLVRAKLAGDPNGIVREAATRFNLEKVMASGNAPTVRILTPGGEIGATDDPVIAQAEIVEQDGGIGRVEWRVNGITISVDRPPSSGPHKPSRMIRSLILDKGRNVIDVIAYNKANLVASRLERIAIVKSGQPADDAALATSNPHRMFVLAAGIDKYADHRLDLESAVADARAMAQAMIVSGKDYYEDVDVKLMTDAEVTGEGLNKAFQELSKKIGPEDVFVLYLAGHGKTIDGQYYFAPANFKMPASLDEAAVISSIRRDGVGQDEWQSWFAQIPARKSIILFDTCESGTLAEDGAGIKALERAAANGRLAQATGRSIITASSNSAEALEGYRGHGLFTFALLDAIGHGDSDGNGTVEIAELAAYVYAEVTALSERVFQQRQEPQMKLLRNYPLTRQAQLPANSDVSSVLDTTPTYELRQAAQLQVRPGDGATVVRSLPTRTAVSVLDTRNGWALVAAHGKPLGYVAVRDLAPVP